MMTKIFTPWVVKFFTPLLQLLAVVIIILTSTQIYYPIFGILGQDNFARYAASVGTFFIYGGIVFVVADLFVNFLERSKRFSILDHIRQSMFLYLLFGYQIRFFLNDYTWVENIQFANRAGLSFHATYILLYGIVINAIFLYVSQKWPRVTKSRIFSSVFIGLIILFMSILGLGFINSKMAQLQNPGMNNPVVLPDGVTPLHLPSPVRR